ncbi:MAG: hypothetical protein ACRDK1_01370 [Solirubrobacterales bacterium]
MVVVATLVAPLSAEAAAPPAHPPRVTIALLPAGTTTADLGAIPDMAVGLLSAGMGSVPPAQTYLDIGQGARVSELLYDEPLPLIRTRRGAAGGATAIPARVWGRVRARAAGAPADLVPGLLGSALVAGGVTTHSEPRGAPAAMLVDRGGRLATPPGCAHGACPVARVAFASPARLRALAAGLRPADLLVALEWPPPAAGHALSIGIAGGGVSGTLTSGSTRMRGYVLATDIGPTVLTRLGLPIPERMSGQPIRGEGAVDAAFVDRLADRLAAIGPRRGPVLGLNLLVWVGLSALAGVAFGRCGLRFALPVLAVAVAYLPAVLLLTAALEPSELAERLIVGVGSLALALATLRLAPGFGALAIAGGVTVAAYAVDVVAGSHLTELSLIGPNPAGGIRFYGIGNELEATLSALVPIATGAALVAWLARASRRVAALAFGIAALGALGAFAPGRFGADVGAAVGIPIGAAVAAGVCLDAGRRRWALLLAAPFIAVAALAAIDLLSGGDAHLTRTVLRAGGLDQLSEVVQRRIQLSVHSFSRYAGTAILWLTVAALVAGAVSWRRIESWFGVRRWAWAGLLGAVAATIAGTLANDSGALLLILGTGVAAVTIGLAWATRPEAENDPREEGTRRNHGVSSL